MKKRKYILIMILSFFIGIININAVSKVSCGNVTSIPSKIPELTSFVVTLLQVAIPVVLVIMGSLDLFKGISASKDDEIKKGQQMLIKRLIVAALIFFVVAIVKFVIGLVSNGENTQNMVECIDCFINNDCNDLLKNSFTCSVDNYKIKINTDGSCNAIRNDGKKVNSTICNYVPMKSSDCWKIEIEDSSKYVSSEVGTVWDVVVNSK